MAVKRELFLLLLLCVHYLTADPEYTGDKFPEEYLHTLEISNEDDLEYYMDRLQKITQFLKDNINATDGNEIIGTYFCKGTLKRTLRDYGIKLTKYREALKKLIWDDEDIMSHFIYKLKIEDESGLASAFPLADDTALVHSIGSFKINVMQKWINNKESLKMNEYIKSMDDLTLSREKYAYISSFTHVSDDYGINGHISDYCLEILEETIQPHDLDTLRPCKIDSHCRDGVFKAPSAAYSLNHRMFIQFMYLTNRRCYLRSPELDLEHLDKLCAAMYRETVYLARRGYFFRDLFMEHIGFCCMMGYEEFHRRRWFRKAASWVKNDGCIEENRNLQLNRTKMQLALAKNDRERKTLTNIVQEKMKTKCHRHQMAVALIALSNAIRHAAHYL